MDNLRGAVLMVASMLAFAVEDMFIKLLAVTLPIGQILFMLGAGGALAFAIAVLVQGDRLFVPVMLSVPIGLRAAGEFIGTLGFISAIALTPLSSASAILQATPLVVTMGAALFLGEAVGIRRWGAICVGLIGVLFIIRPGTDSFEPLSLLALLAVFGLGIRDLATRRVPSTISTMQLSFLGFLVVVPAGVLLALLSGQPFIVLSTQTWIYFGAAFVVGLFAYYGIVAAMRVGEVSFVTPFRYTRLVFAMGIGLVVFNEAPDAFTYLGAAIIVASGIYTVWRERIVALAA